MTSPSETLVLVTGGSGFLGSYCIIALLNAGYQVRTTIRSLYKSEAVRESLKNGNIKDISSLDRLSFAAADLFYDAGWEEAIAGCKFIMHVASPFPDRLPKREDDLIVPAREGTLRVLRIAKTAGVKRVVLTSSFSAVGHGLPAQKAPFTEESWTNTASHDVTAYDKSKTVAERAAWAFVKSPEGQGLELSVINPVLVLGPVLSADYSTSIILIRRLLDGEMPGCPNLFYGIVDVRDCASLHLLAMTSPDAAGERFLAASPPTMSIQEIAITLKARMPEEAKKAKTRTVPNFLIRIVALWDSEVASVVGSLGRVADASNEKAKRVLGWEPMSGADSIVATAESLIKLSLVKK